MNRLATLFLLLAAAAAPGCMTKLEVVGDREADVWVQAVNTPAYRMETYIGRAEMEKVEGAAPSASGAARAPTYRFRWTVPEELVNGNMSVHIRAAEATWSYDIYARKGETITLRFPRADYLGPDPASAPKPAAAAPAARAAAPPKGTTTGAAPVPFTSGGGR